MICLKKVGRGRVLREGSRVAILGYGTIVQNCLAAAQLLQTLDISVTVADARFCKPLDGNLIRQLAQEHEVLITVEEGSIGGFSSHVSHYLGLNGLLDGNLKVIILLLFFFFGKDPSLVRSPHSLFPFLPLDKPPNPNGHV